MIVAPALRRQLTAARCLLVGCGLFALTGCNFIHNYGSGTHLDAPREKAENKRAAKAATVQAEAVTNADGEVVSIQIVRSSGSNALDNYFADSIRTNHPFGPSTRSLVEIHYDPASGFGNPKILSSVPAS